MRHIAHQSSNISNIRSCILAIVSLIIGIFGFILPCLAYILAGFYPNDFLIVIDTIGPENYDLLSRNIPFALSLAGPAAIIIGALAMKKNDLGNITKAGEITAVAGITLGIMTILCALLPFLLFLQLYNACKNGC